MFIYIIYQYNYKSVRECHRVALDCCYASTSIDSPKVKHFVIGIRIIMLENHL
jgi:hypothetical protein